MVCVLSESVTPIKTYGKLISKHDAWGVQLGYHDHDGRPTLRQLAMAHDACSPCSGLQRYKFIFVKLVLLSQARLLDLLGKIED